MIYITADSNNGIFWERFCKKKSKFEKGDKLIILGDTGMSPENNLEAHFKLMWFEEASFTTYIVPLYRANDDGVNVKYMRSGKIYFLDDIQFLVLCDSIELESMVEIEVDYILATNHEILGEAKNKIKFKHAYIIGCGNATIQEDNITVLDEDIVEIV